MKITMIAAISQDGFLNHTQNEQATDWTSKEDQQHYAETLRQFKLQFMGVKTYLAYQDKISLKRDIQRLIFTHHPADFTSLPGKVEFTSESFEAAMARMTAAGYTKAILVGGGTLFTQFLQHKLVDEAYITIEPLNFGAGVAFLPPGVTMQDFTYLALQNTSPLNNHGTVLQVYLRK